MTALDPMHPAVRTKLEAARLDNRERTKFEQDLNTTFDEAKTLLLRKHLDYGPNNIALAPGGAVNGLRVRMHDKLARINHLVDNNQDPANESLRDSFIDLLNYAAIGLMVLDENWDSTK